MHVGLTFKGMCAPITYKSKGLVNTHTQIYIHIDEIQSFLFWFPWYFKGEHLHLCKIITAWMHFSKCKRRHYFLLHMQILPWMLMLMLRIIRDFFCNWKTRIKYLTGDFLFFLSKTILCYHNTVLFTQQTESKFQVKDCIKKGEENFLPGLV